MKKLVLILAMAGFMGAGAVAAYACEGGKCKMEHAAKDKKGRKGKKAAESCHMATATAENKEAKPACCMKKGTAASETAKETKKQ
ncbi:MAG TPA: hypothetical protein VIG72_08225 [Pontibacter sp.]